MVLWGTLVYCPLCHWVWDGGILAFVPTGEEGSGLAGQALAELASRDRAGRAALVALHGSWNRSTRIGYRVSLVRLEGDRAVGYEPFAAGWLLGGDVRGRPVNILVMPDGAMLVSDDHAGAIYRVTFSAD